MANLKDIRRRIDSVKNTQKVTKSMKMVSGAKLRRAEEAASRSRPYASQLDDTIAQLIASLEDDAHPLITPRAETAKVEWIVVGSDRGLCGSFNAQVLRNVEPRMRAEVGAGLDVSVVAVGRKPRDFFKRRSYTITAQPNGFSAAPSAADAAGIARGAIERFTSGEVDEVRVIYNTFVSAMTQVATVVQLLPIQPEPAEADATAAGEASASVDAILEPHRSELLSVLLPLQVENRLYRALLESAASEHAARMTAMESATSNAGEMIDSLTLQYNKARQAAITKELMEIVGGAEALAASGG